MHEAHNVATGTAHIPDETFSAKEMDFFVPVLRINLYDLTYLAGRDTVRPGGCLTTGVVNLRLKRFEHVTR